MKVTTLEHIKKNVELITMQAIHYRENMIVNLKNIFNKTADITDLIRPVAKNE